MEDSREEHRRDVFKDVEDKSKIHYLRCGVYTIEEEVLIKRKSLVPVPHPKGGNTV